jgi:hypothetical protein
MMPEVSMPTILDVNRQLANKLYAEAHQSPQSPYAGKKVGIANGQVVVVADDWDDIARALEAAEPDASNTYCIDMAQDYSQTEFIWGATAWPAPSGR